MAGDREATHDKNSYNLDNLTVTELKSDVAVAENNLQYSVCLIEISRHHEITFPGLTKMAPSLSFLNAR